MSYLHLTELRTKEAMKTAITFNKILSKQHKERAGFTWLRGLMPIFILAKVESSRYKNERKINHG